MKKTLLLVLGWLCIAASYAADSTISIIPQPVSMTRGNGYFPLPKGITINVPEDPACKATADLLQKRLSITGSTITMGGRSPVIQLSLNKAANAKLGNEGYLLSVKPSGVIITANKPAGLFYGVQTLLQLLPAEIDSKTAVQNVAWQVPVVEIMDYPRFGWRGLMFDVSRHFFTKEDVKAYIDDMVRYKYNLLHLHLTDDEGWRIEIKSLPNLTKVGAWRVDKTGTFGNMIPPAADEPRTYGGFYTQDDIRELVQYAKERFVNILPEIDVPGHSMAALAAYPEISCTPGTYQVRSGERIMNWYSGGFSAIQDNTVCPANEKAYAFLDKVFTELAQLFPFEYIHVGGDECAKNFWEKSDEIKQLMQKEKLKTMEEVQSYFEKRVEKIVESKGKKIIGWDEILEGGLAPNAMVMSWRGIKGGIAAARMHHDVVMSPTTYVYLDYMQSDSINEPPVYATLRLNKTYQFEPVPDSVDAKYIKGGQGNLWTEQVYTFRQVQYMTWPRGLAIAESVWSPKEAKNWNNFVERVEAQLPRFDAAEIKYSPGMYDPDFIPSFNDKGALQVALKSEIDGLELHYSFDNSHPDQFYPKYTDVLTVPVDASLLRVVIFRNGKQVGRENNMPIASLKYRAGLPQRK